MSLNPQVLFLPPCSQKVLLLPSLQLINRLILGSLVILAVALSTFQIQRWRHNTERRRNDRTIKTKAMESNTIHNRSRNRKQGSGDAPRRKGHKKNKRINEEQLTNSLRRLCTSRNLIESTSGIQKRHRVMKDLNDMLCSWCSSLSSDVKASPALLSFGSYRLGVHTPDADVDCLVLAPRHVTRQDFFGGWVDVLRGDDRVTELHPVARCV